MANRPVMNEARPAVQLPVLHPASPNSHAHRSPAWPSSTPCAPVHLWILVHLSGPEIPIRNVICDAELLVTLVLLRSADIGLVMSRIRENVIGSPLSVDH